MKNNNWGGNWQTNNFDVTVFYMEKHSLCFISLLDYICDFHAATE